MLFGVSSRTTPRPSRPIDNVQDDAQDAVEGEIDTEGARRAIVPEDKLLDAERLSEHGEIKDSRLVDGALVQVLALFGVLDLEGNLGVRYPSALSVCARRARVA